VTAVRNPKPNLELLVLALLQIAQELETGNGPEDQTEAQQ
jgi:hypothetical protein